MIDRSTVDRIIDTANIVEVVGDFISLKRRGANYIACCPFHHEKTPSFSVSAAKGIYKCFGCGKAGNAVSFVMEHEHMTYVEALKYLARKYGIEVQEREVTPEEKLADTRRESMMVVSSYAQQYFSDVLWRNAEGKNIGLSYFRERGFTDKTIQHFQLGYSLDSRNAFSKEALKEGYKKEFLSATGLSIEKGDDLIDRFSGRVMFPIHSLSGRVIAFGARTLKQDKTVAKYLNSPESDIYSKSFVLYGMFQAKQSIVRAQKCYLVEGYTDVISMHQAGIENVVASSGTSLTTEQIRLIKRFAPNATVLYDGDAAGIKAALRGIDMLLEEGLNVKVVLFPDGDDPDSFARKHNAQELQEFLDANEKDFILFKTKLLADDAQNDPIKRAALINDVVRSISVIPDAITRTVYVKECSRLLNIEEEILLPEVNKLRHKKIYEGKTDKPHSEMPTMGVPPDTEPVAPTPALPAFVTDIYCEAAEKELIYFLLKHGHRDLFAIEQDGETKIITVSDYIIAELLNDELELKNLHYRQLFDEYGKVLDMEPDLRLKHFINHPDQQISELVINMLSVEHPITVKRFAESEEPEEARLVRDVPKAILVYKSKITNQAYAATSEQLRVAQQNNNTEELLTLLDRIRVLQQVRNTFSKDLKRLTL